MVGYPSFVAQAAGGYVHNTYTAGGQRLESRRTDAQGTVTTMSYEGNEIFENGKLRMRLFDGGYVDFSGSEPRYCWYTKDHLGSVRSVVGGMTKLAGETAKTATEGNTKPSGRALSIEQGVLKTEEVSDIHGMYYNPKF